MSEFLKRNATSKTFWTVVVALITTAGAFMTGEIDKVTAVQSAIGSIMVMFARDTIAAK
ncbi:MAG: hypothetical protein OEY97_07825 [Nitrospirota bacterium]|nr:hypothetical protein [Gammaproteobacteria bacterium]MDH5527199.1 hypothetical protein [Nitrospirota bacterium]